MTIKFLENLVINSEEWQTAPFRFFGKNEVVPLNFAISGDTPSWQDIIISGNGSLTLANAKANGLNYLKLFGKCEQRNLPEGYTQTDYTIMSVGSYILTDIIPESGGRIELDFQTTTLSSQITTFLGARSGSSAGNGIRLGHTADNNILIYGFQNNGGYTSSAKFSDNTRYKFVYNNGVATITSGGTTVDTHTFTSLSEITKTIALNAYNYTTISGNNESIYVYSFKIWDNNGNLVLNYISDRQNTDAGFYDTVISMQVPPTSGTFIAGAEAVPTPDNPLDIVCNNGALKFGYGHNLIDNTVDGQGTFVAPAETTTTRIYKALGQLPNGKYKVSITGNFEFILQYKDAIEDYTEYGNIGTWTTSEVYDVETTGYYYGIAIRYPNNAKIIPTNFNGTLSLQIQGIYTDGTTETVEVDTTGDTATAEMLLKVGDYQDVQEVLSGDVTRNVGILVLDGTEDWVKASNYTNIFYAPISGAYYNDTSAERIAVPCTHFVGTDATNTNMVDNSIKLTAQGSALTNPLIYIKASVSENDLTTWQTWLATQYQNGAPVIIIFPLKTPTTETVTAQPLTIQAGTNIVEITQASIDNLPLEVSYKGTV